MGGPLIGPALDADRSRDYRRSAGPLAAQVRPWAGSAARATPEGVALLPHAFARLTRARISCSR